MNKQLWKKKMDNQNRHKLKILPSTTKYSVLGVSKGWLKNLPVNLDVRSIQRPIGAPKTITVRASAAP